MWGKYRTLTDKPEVILASVGSNGERQGRAIGNPWWLGVEVGSCPLRRVSVRGRDPPARWAH